MNIALWIVQGLLAFAFFMVGLMKVTKPKEELKEKVGGWVDDFSQGQVRVIGVLEILAAIGLIAPLLSGVLPILTPLAAAGLVLTMLVATGVHARRSEPFVPNIVLALLAVFVVYGRYFIDLV